MPEPVSEMRMRIWEVSSACRMERRKEWIGRVEEEEEGREVRRGVVSVVRSSELAGWEVPGFQNVGADEVVDDMVGWTRPAGRAQGR